MKQHTCVLTQTTADGSVPPPCEACQEHHWRNYRIPSDHAVASAISFMREAWRGNDGAEGDAVKLLCDELERLRLQPRPVKGAATENDPVCAHCDRPLEWSRDHGIATAIRCLHCRIIYCPACAGRHFGTDAEGKPVKDAATGDREVWDRGLAQERDAVRSLGERIGYGNMMTLAQELWREKLDAQGVAGGEFSLGPCVGVTGKSQLTTEDLAVPFVQSPAGHWLRKSWEAHEHSKELRSIIDGSQLTAEDRRFIELWHAVRALAGLETA
jgi:hypothetical protein